MQPDEFPKFVEKVLNEFKSQSIRIEVETRQTDSDKNEMKFDYVYIQTNKGFRFFDTKTTLQGDVYRETGHYDGQKCALVQFEDKKPEQQKIILVQRAFMYESSTGFLDAPDPLRWHQVGLTPLHEALVGAERLNDVSVIEKDCHVFHFRNVGLGKKQSLVYALDKTTGVPLRVSAYDNPQSIQEQTPNWVWEAKTLDKVGNHHFPINSIYTTYVKTPEGKHKPRISRTTQVKKIEYDVSYPASTFWPVAQPGVTILDSIEKKRQIVPRSEKQSPTTAIPKVDDRPPVRVDDPSNGFGASGAVLVGSMVILVLAFFLWKKAR